MKVEGVGSMVAVAHRVSGRLLVKADLWGETPAVSSKLRSTPAAAVVRKSAAMGDYRAK